MPAKAGIALHVGAMPPNTRRQRPCRSAPCARCSCSCCIQSEERSIASGDRVTFSLRAQRESNQRERAPRLALAGHRATAPALPQLRHPCRRLPWRKGIGIHADARCAACRPRLTAAQGPRVEQRAFLGPHSVRNRCAVARAGYGGQRERLLSATTRQSTLQSSRPRADVRRACNGADSGMGISLTQRCS